MVTYTVFNIASCPGEDVLGGLTLLGAIGRLMRLSGCNWWCSRDNGGVMRMEIFPEAAVVGDALSSKNPDDDAARDEIFGRIANGRVVLPSTYVIVPDTQFQRGPYLRRTEAAA
ncbi:hypothetical protein [Paracoccus onubensis]|nr:hypothetical protein [Paracoccus onubensis]